MTPSVGRIVHYYPPGDHGKSAEGTGLRARKGQPYPAIITHVWSDSCVNLRVFDDGSFGLGSGSATPAVTSCMRGHVETGGEIGAYWDWPPRV